MWRIHLVFMTASNPDSCVPVFIILYISSFQQKKTTTACCFNNNCRYYCSRRELCCFTRECNSGLVFNFRHVLLLFQCFPKSFKNRDLYLSAAGCVFRLGCCFYFERKWTALEKELKVFFNPFLSYLSGITLRNDRKFKL